VNKEKCRDCKFCRKIEPSIINPDEVDIAKDLADCLLKNTTVIVNNEVCEDFKNKHKKEIKKKED
jgi:hypothetical protein